MSPVATSAPAVPRLDELDINDLRELMQAVNETTQRLQATHVTLQNQVARLQHELAEANAALRRSQSLAALGEMAAGIAHEVRNPLGSIQLYVQMLSEDLADRPEQAAICTKIDRAVVGLEAIVRDVLAFARETKIDPQPTTAEELLERAFSGCDSLFNGGITVVRDPASAEHRLHADVGLMTQALANVIRNAVEAINDSNDPRREIRAGAERRRMRCPSGRTEPRIVIIIQDTGPGVPEDIRHRLFNPFFTTRRTGTGLGLAIVHRIIDAHGGHILIENSAPPRTGARFELCLPPRPLVSPGSAPRPRSLIPDP